MLYVVITTVIIYRYKSNVSELLNVCFKDDTSSLLAYLKQYMESVYSYDYDETPDYMALKGILNETLDRKRWKDNKNGLEWLPGKVHVCTLRKNIYMYVHVSTTKLAMFFVRSLRCTTPKTGQKCFYWSTEHN